MVRFVLSFKVAEEISVPINEKRNALIHNACLQRKPSMQTQH